MKSGKPFDTPYGPATYHIDGNNKTCVVSYFTNTQHDPTKIEIAKMYPPATEGWKRDVDGKVRLDERFIPPYGTRLLFSFPVVES